MSWYDKWLDFGHKHLNSKNTPETVLYDHYKGVNKDFKNIDWAQDLKPKYRDVDDEFFVSNAKYHLMQDKDLTADDITQITNFKTRKEVMAYIMKPKTEK